MSSKSVRTKRSAPEKDEGFDRPRHSKKHKSGKDEVSETLDWPLFEGANKSQDKSSKPRRRGTIAHTPARKGSANETMRLPNSEPRTKRTKATENLVEVERRLEKILQDRRDRDLDFLSRNSGSKLEMLDEITKARDEMFKRLMREYEKIHALRKQAEKGPTETEHKKKLRIVKEQYNLMAADLEQSRDEARLEKESVERLKKALAEVENKYVEEKGQFVRRKTRLDSAKRKNAALTELLKTTRDYYAKASAQASDAQSRVAQLSEQVNQMQDVIEQQHKVIRNAQLHLDMSRSAMENKVRDEMQAQLEKNIGEKTQEVITKHNDAEMRKREKLHDKLKDLKNTVHSMQSKMEDHQQKAEDAIEKHTRLESQNEHLKAQLALQEEEFAKKQQKMQQNLATARADHDKLVELQTARDHAMTAAGLDVDLERLLSNLETFITEQDERHVNTKHAVKEHYATMLKNMETANTEASAQMEASMAHLENIKKPSSSSSSMKKMKSAYDSEEDHAVAAHQAAVTAALTEPQTDEEMPDVSKSSSSSSTGTSASSKLAKHRLPSRRRGARRATAYNQKPRRDKENITPPSKIAKKSSNLATSTSPATSKLAAAAKYILGSVMTPSKQRSTNEQPLREQLA